MQTEFAISLAKNEGSLGDGSGLGCADGGGRRTDAIFHRDFLLAARSQNGPEEEGARELSFWRRSNGSSAAAAL